MELTFIELMDMRLEMKTEQKNRIKLLPYLVIGLLDLFTIYFFCNFSIGSEEDQILYFREEALNMFLVRFFFSSISTFFISMVLLVLACTIYYIIKHVVGSPKKHEWYSLLFTQIKTYYINLIVIIVVETLLILLFKYSMNGYV